MKARELMVGSNVMVYPSNMVIKVAGVCGMHVGYIASGKHIEWVEESLVRPIPLSKVHLVKNGFKAEDESDYEFVYNDGYELKVVFDDGIPELIEPFIMLQIEFADKSLEMEVKYLHTLQQALKLYEVDKEIEI